MVEREAQVAQGEADLAAEHRRAEARGALEQHQMVRGVVSVLEATLDTRTMVVVEGEDIMEEEEERSQEEEGGRAMPQILRPHTIKGTTTETEWCM